MIYEILAHTNQDVEERFNKDSFNQIIGQELPVKDPWGNERIGFVLNAEVSEDGRSIRIIIEM